MRWLEDHRDESECKVRDALDVAVTRIDDLALRRVWSRLADVIPVSRGLRGRLRWSVLLTVGGLVGGIAVGAMLLRPSTAELVHLGPSIVTTRSATAAPTPAPAEALAAPKPPGVEDPTSILVGPTTVHTGTRAGRSVRLMNGARIHLRAQSTLVVDAGQRATLRRGRARLDVPKQPRGEPFTIAAGPYVVVVVGTKFNLAVSSRGVEVDVREGLVEVWRGGEVTRLGAGDSWKGPEQSQSFAPRRRSLALVARRGPPPAAASTQHPSDGYQEAMAALGRGDTVIALSLLRQAARSEGPAGENSGFAIGLVLRDHVFQPRQAVEAWTSYRERYPNGLLRQETDVSIIETLLELGDRAAARLEVEAFLRLHPGSEWYGQMAALAAKLAEAPTRNPAETSAETSAQPGRTLQIETKDAEKGTGSGEPSAMRPY